MQQNSLRDKSSETEGSSWMITVLNSIRAAKLFATNIFTNWAVQFDG